MSKRQFMQGNDAISSGALYAGCRFFAGYPITPSTEIAERLALELPRHGGRFIQMEDEISAMAAVIGASISGVKSLTATSGPGMSLKLENLGFGYMAEVPCVVVNVQRGGPSTGMPTGPSQSDIMQARWGTHGDHSCITLTPSTVREQFIETVRAFNLAEKYRIPVILLTDEIIGHMRENFDMPDEGELEIINRTKPTVLPAEYKPYQASGVGFIRDVPPMANFGEGYRYHITGLNHDATGFPTNSGAVAGEQNARLIRKIEANYDDIVQVEEYRCEDAETLIFAIGGTARSAKEAVDKAREAGIKAGLLKPLTIWPFPDKHIAKYKGRAKKIVVAELNLGQLINEVRRVAEGAFELVPLQRVDGEPITPKQIVEAIK
ncbi:MAG: 2-oxoacid:acceptor oxidoreductase subunit alpha [Deferribacteraceae bacterium]|nr:2-oxoacid:acceptor oxidoreductase subunit alpha [Deferribacteraceae bacterium]